VTQAKVRKLVKNWQAFLGLTHWDVSVDFETPAGDDTVARVWRSNYYDKAIIYLDVEWKSWTQIEANHVVAHELVHLLTRDLEEAIASVRGHVTEDGAWLAIEDRLSHELEGVVDRLADKLVTLAYS